VSRTLALCGALPLVALLAMLAAGSAAGAPARALAGCGHAYKYSGDQDSKARSGIRVTLATIAPPGVISGHTAGWVGVGGVGLGPGGADEWLQTGYSAFTTGQKQIYYEVTRPGGNPRYYTVKNTVGLSEKHEVAVVEVGGRPPGTWQVYVDNRPASPPVYLPGSHGRFPPQAIGESWNDGAATCNSYNYGFADMQVTDSPGGAWIPAKLFGFAWNDKQDETVKTSATAFIARSRTLTAARATQNDVPPLLGSIASKLTGRHLTATCAKQGKAVVERPGGHVVFSNTVCETLVGYAMAMPAAPAADTRPGRFVARTTLAFLRGVEEVAPKPPADADCYAVTKFATVLPELGATPQGARDLRTALLADNANIAPKLALGADCPFQVKAKTAPFAPPQPPPPTTPTTPAAPTTPTLTIPAAPATPATSTSATPAVPTPSTPSLLTVTVHTSSVFGTAPGLAGLPPSGAAVTYSPASQAAHVSGSLTCSTTATAASNVGSYPITGCSGLADPGFSVVYDLAGSSHAVVEASQTITFAPLSDRTLGDPGFALGATAGSGLPVSYTASGPCSVSGPTVQPTGTGTCSITASQAGSGNVDAAASVTQTFTIAAQPAAKGTVPGHGGVLQTGDGRLSQGQIDLEPGPSGH
jgi:hypothetical protein